MIKYVVVCDNNPLAYVDDNRSAGGGLSISAPPGGASQIVIGYRHREGFSRPTHDAVAGTWGESTLSRTVWADDGDYADTGRTQWTVRCGGCGYQAEINQDNLASLADLLAAALVELDKANPPILGRHVIPLRTLCLMVTRFNL
jgi:hypothetical protein